MGYTTDFYGEFALDKPLTVAHQVYLDAFAERRRCRMNVEALAGVPGPVREAVGLPLGPDGGYYVGVTEERRNPPYKHPTIADYNTPPSGQPGLWCQWVPNEAGTAIEQDGGEKFYHYAEWLEYIIKHFLAPWGYKLNGQVEWHGEDTEDVGVLYVKDNAVEAVQSAIVNAGPSWGKE